MNETLNEKNISLNEDKFYYILANLRVLIMLLRNSLFLSLFFSLCFNHAFMETS